MLGHSWYKLHHHFSDRLPRSCPADLYIFRIRKSGAVDCAAQIGGISSELGAVVRNVEVSSPNTVSHHWKYLYISMKILIFWLIIARLAGRLWELEWWNVAVQARDRLVPPIGPHQSTEQALRTPTIFRFVGKLRGNRSEKWWWSLYQLCPSIVRGYDLCFKKRHCYITMESEVHTGFGNIEDNFFQNSRKLVSRPIQLKFYFFMWCKYIKYT